jgi:hypothetical protein
MRFPSKIFITFTVFLLLFLIFVKDSYAGCQITADGDCMGSCSCASIGKCGSCDCKGDRYSCNPNWSNCYPCPTDTPKPGGGTQPTDTPQPTNGASPTLSSKCDCGKYDGSCDKDSTPVCNCAKNPGKWNVLAQVVVVLSGLVGLPVIRPQTASKHNTVWTATPTLRLEPVVIMPAAALAVVAAQLFFLASGFSTQNSHRFPFPALPFAKSTVGTALVLSILAKVMFLRLFFPAR